ACSVTYGSHSTRCPFPCRPTCRISLWYRSATAVCRHANTSELSHRYCRLSTDCPRNRSSSREYRWGPPSDLPRNDNVAFWIELDHRRRGSPNLFFLGRQVVRVGSPVHNEHMVICIDARAAHISGHPVIWQRLGPERVHLKVD